MTSLYDRAAIIPGRSMTRSKAPDRLMKAWTRGGNHGAYVLDEDGRELLDMGCALGARSLTNDPYRCAESGVYSLPSIREIEAAEAVLQHVAPWASSVRCLKTGSEATHAAYRIAKAATGRPIVLVGDGAYHGWHECWGHENLGTRFYQHGGTTWIDDIVGAEVAAVFVEPQRFEPESAAWLHAVRRYCDQHGALLVFDSMLYGGRWALGGASEYFGVQPDLECFGKAFGNGQPVAFVVGTQALAEHGELVSGTFSGDVTGLSAVCDVLHTYTTEPVIETLWARGKQLGDGLKHVLPRSFASIDGAAPLQRIRFQRPEHQEPFKAAMAERGVLMYPDWFMTMYAHTDQQINQVIEAAEASCRTLIS